ncbi:hypothetical protein BBP40_006745 [Aspergillus hancockii]|nr:hypothetical protein BBP40_006745 [Aspergillus hancockii]
MSTASNAAAWLTTAKSYPFEVKEAPLRKPEENEILTRNYAVAINPVDGSLQTKAWCPMNYPTILGQAVAGEVIAVGQNVTCFKTSDRVVGHAVGMATKHNQDNAFQTYTILQVNMASKLPDHVSYQDAAVIPLAFSTAASGLFQDEFLKLQLPTEPRAQPAGKTLLIWGGASSVGSNAIQLADKTLAGAMDCIGFSATPTCMNVVHKSDGNKLIATVKGGFPILPDSVSVKSVFGTTIKDNFVGNAVYVDFLPLALKAGNFCARS